MHTLTNSAFLQALGYAIAHSLWQIAIVWVVYTGIINFVQLSARTKYAVAVTAQLSGFIWFAFTFQYYYFECLQAASDRGSLIAAKGITFIIPYTGDGFKSYLLSFFLKTEQLLPYLSIAYLLILIVLFAKWMTSYNTAQNLRHKGLHKIHVDWKLFVKQTATYLGIKKEVQIFLSEHISTPLTIGFLKPVILVPLASMNHLSTEQMEAVLLHELAHIKRMDYLLNISLSIIETILFFNPFSQLISKSIQLERENSCDDWVLQFQYNPATYATALLQIASLQAAPAMAMTAVKNQNDLLSRVKRMIDTNNKPFNYRNQLLAFLLITVVLVAVTWIMPQEQKQITNIQNSFSAKNSNPVMIEPMATKVSNPLFNPLFFFRKPLQEEIKKSIHLAEKEMSIASKEIKDFPAEVAPVMPITIRTFESVNTNPENEKQIERVIIATTSSKKNLEENYTISTENAYTKNLEQWNNDLQKVTTEIEETHKVSGNSKAKNNLEEELIKAAEQFKKLKLPFSNQLFFGQKQIKATVNMSSSVATTAFEVAKNKIRIDSLKQANGERKTKSIIARNERQNRIELNNLAETIPGLNYAINYSTEEVPIITTSTINNEEITFITIKRKQKEIDEIQEEPATNKVPKHYEVVVSNRGKPDKKIIIEVL